MPKLSGKAVGNLLWYAVFLGALAWVISLGFSLRPVHEQRQQTGRMQADGHVLMRSMFIADDEAGLNLGVNLPDGQYSNATQYLELLLEHGAINSLDGYIDAQGRSRWCVVEKLSRDLVEIPWLFSSNAPLEYLNQPLKASEVADLFGQPKVLVIYPDHSDVMSAEAVAAGKLGRGLSNRVLRP